jgi:hypothetical protein
MAILMANVNWPRSLGPADTDSNGDILANVNSNSIGNSNYRMLLITAVCLL